MTSNVNIIEAADGVKYHTQEYQEYQQLSHQIFVKNKVYTAILSSLGWSKEKERNMHCHKERGSELFKPTT